MTSVLIRRGEHHVTAEGGHVTTGRDGSDAATSQVPPRMDSHH